MLTLLLSLGLSAPLAPPDTAQVGESVVTATRVPLDDASQTLSTVSVVGRGRIEAAHDPSALSVLDGQVPGFFLTRRGLLGYGVSGGSAGTMTLRGGSVLVLVDGHPQYQGIMGHPIADAYLSDIAERVEVVRGPQSVLYGSGAMGGVVHLVTRKPAADGRHTHIGLGGGSYGTVLGSLTHRQRIDRFSLTASASCNTTRGHRANEPFRQASGSLRLGYDFSPRWSLTASADITQFLTANPGTVAQPLADSDQRVTRLMSTLALTHRHRRAEGALLAHYSWGRHKVDDGHAAGQPPRDYEFNSADDMAGVSAYETLRLLPGGTLTAGADFFVYGGQQWNRPTGTHDRRDEKDYHRRQWAGYAQLRQKAARRLTLEAGTRADRHSSAGTVWTAQGGLILSLPREATLKALVAQGFRFPSLRELYTMRPANPDLRSERSVNYELAYSQKLLGGRLRLGASLYYLDADRLIQTVFADGRPHFVNSGTVYNTGLELEAGLRLGRGWRLEGNYSFTHMAHALLATPRHKASASADFGRGRWQAHTGLQYVGGLYTSVAPEQRESYVLWDVRAGYRPCRFASLWLKGENLLAQAYEINAGFPMPRATVSAGIDLHF